MSLDDIRARAEKATPAPWELAGGNEWLSPLGIDVGSEDESSRPTLLVKDAEFIAHARTDIPKLLAALDAVQAAHEPTDALMYSGRHQRVVQVCTGCGTDDGNWQHYPCPTVRAITQALA